MSSTASPGDAALPGEAQIARDSEVSVESHGQTGLAIATTRNTSPWWIFLATGPLWILIAWVVLRFNYRSVAAIAVLAGTVILLAAIAETYMAMFRLRKDPRALDEVMVAAKTT